MAIAGRSDLAPAQGIAPGTGGKQPATHWAFRTRTRPPVPVMQGTHGSQTPIDRFIFAKLQEKQLRPNPEADRATLIRRVCFDLTGLPPTPLEVTAFCGDQSPDAYEKMVERYLASPRYGERWGKYWLDVAGYADSNGYFSADSDRPLAWKYRDYVIRSFNADKPYDSFVREQLAGDELAGFTPEGDVTPQMIEPLTATHFLRNAPDGTGESDGNPDELRSDRFAVLEGNLQITMNALLGITIQCARCHSHKFEPISREEYYSLQAILYPVYNPDRWVKPNHRAVTVGTRKQRAEFQKRNELVNRQIKALQDGLAAALTPLREQLIDERLHHLEPTVREAVLAAIDLLSTKRSKEQRELVKKYVDSLHLGEEEVAKRFPEYAALRDQYHKAIAAREKDRTRPLDKLQAFVETDPNPPTHHVLIRGQYNSQGREVEPGVPAALCTPTNRYRLCPRDPRRLDGKEEKPISSGRRSAFVRWVTSPENPLFARVMVNRVWQHHFAAGLVMTPDNLGQSGARPSHPELLDWLATEFRESGYSVKHLHRLILHSAVFRQSSVPRQDGLVRDPENRLLWRYPLRRLDAEALRDGMLAVSGELDSHAGGPYVATQRTGDDSIEVDEKQAGAGRRSVYLQQRRSQVATFLELFDAPRIAVNCSARPTSTVPLQALELLNSEFIRRRAAAFAKRLVQATGADLEKRLTLAFLLAYGREPIEAERAAACQMLQSLQDTYANATDAELRRWTDFCQMVLASNAFLYLE
jgi:hypothetical protein